MPTENTQNKTTNVKQDMSIVHPDPGDNTPPASASPTPQDPPAPKESYAAYIKNLPPPFWATKTPPPTKPANEEAIAARIAAVCAPVTAKQREEDERVRSMSWRERWRERKVRRASGEKDKDRDREREVDLRPMERGSRAQINVFGVNVREKRGERR